MHSATLLAGAADPRLAKLADRMLLAERSLQRAQLCVGASSAVHLCHNEVGAVPLEAVKLEHEAADVSELDLAQAAQVPGATTDPAALAKAGLKYID